MKRLVVKVRIEETAGTSRRHRLIKLNVPPASMQAAGLSPLQHKRRNLRNAISADFVRMKIVRPNTKVNQGCHRFQSA